MVEQLSDIDKAYIAGLVDGEGSIMITKQMPTSRVSGNVTPQYMFRVSVSNTHKGVLDWLHSKCGGELTDNGYIGGKGGHRLVYEWRIKGQSAIDFIQDIRDFLRIKPAQAWLALEAREQFTYRTGGYGRVSAEELALREGYRLAMQNLNAGRAGI